MLVLSYFLKDNLFSLPVTMRTILALCVNTTKNAIEVMKKYGVDLTDHRATDIFDSDIENYDLTLCMTEQQKYNILAFFPKLKGKVFTLKEYIDGSDMQNIDIDDPWGYSIKIYEACAKEIVDYVDKLLNKI